MSIDALRWAFQQQGLRSPVKFVLIALADRADSQDICWPSIQQIVMDTCLSKDTVCKATAELEELGLVTRQKRFNDSVVYQLQGVPCRHSIPKNQNSEKQGSSIPKSRKLTPMNPQTSNSIEKHRPSDAEQVFDYMVEKGLDPKVATIEADKFWNHFESNGWKVGGKAPMKNWKSAVSNWLTRVNPNPSQQKVVNDPPQNKTRGWAGTIEEDLTNVEW